MFFLVFFFFLFCFLFLFFFFGFCLCLVLSLFCFLLICNREHLRTPSNHSKCSKTLPHEGSKHYRWTLRHHKWQNLCLIFMVFPIHYMTGEGKFWPKHITMQYVMRSSKMSLKSKNVVFSFLVFPIWVLFKL